ncbi:MAG: hypothetical protein ACLTX3_08550 [Lachnospiraceae bacterium]
MKFENLKQIIVGDYVCTPIKNAFNNKTAYWLSKDGCMLSLYMFTAEECFSQEDFDSRFSDESLAQYITMFERRSIRSSTINSTLNSARKRNCI